MAINIGNTGTPSAAPLPAAPQSQGSAPQPAAKVQVALPELVQQQQPEPAQVQKAVETLKQLIETKAPNSLAFSIDDATGKTISPHHRCTDRRDDPPDSFRGNAGNRPLAGQDARHAVTTGSLRHDTGSNGSPPDASRCGLFALWDRSKSA